MYLYKSCVDNMLSFLLQNEGGESLDRTEIK